MDRTKHLSWTGFAAAMLVLAGTMLGCSVTQKAAVEKSSLSASGFLGPDYARLTPGGKDQASLVYINPSAQWTQYRKILVMPVSFWGNEATKIPLADQQARSATSFTRLYVTSSARSFSWPNNPGLA
jgi:Protein of unknown function (DUF3313)